MLTGIDAFIKTCDKGFRVDNVLPYEQEAQGKTYEQHLDDRQIVDLFGEAYFV